MNDRIKLASRAHWKRVTKRRYGSWKVSEEHFTGYVTRLDLLGVSSPLLVQNHMQTLCVADSGYSWLQHFPAGTHYTLTSQWNEKGQLAQWYFDICERHGVTEDGTPYWEDLYLDVIGLPSGVFEIIDQDELEEAWQQQHISLEQYTLAKREAKQLLRLLNAGNFGLLEVAKHHYNTLTINSVREDSSS